MSILYSVLHFYLSRSMKNKLEIGSIKLPYDVTFQQLSYVTYSPPHPPPKKKKQLEGFQNMLRAAG